MFATTNQPTPYQQIFMTQQHEKDLYNFLSLGCGGRCRELSKQLQLAIQRKQQIKIVRVRTAKIMKNIGLDKGLANKLSLLLSRSGLSLQEQRTITKCIKKLLLDFKRDLHNNLTLGKLNLNRLPLSLRRFVIALIVLKAEIAHLFRLELERQRVTREMNNLSRVSIEKRHHNAQQSYGTDHYELYSMGISMTPGDFDGTRGERRSSTPNQTREEKNVHMEFCISKQNRNQADFRYKSSTEYNQQDHNNLKQKASIDKNDFYQPQTHKTM